MIQSLMLRNVETGTLVSRLPKGFSCSGLSGKNSWINLASSRQGTGHIYVSDVGQLAENGIPGIQESGCRGSVRCTMQGAVVVPYARQRGDWCCTFLPRTINSTSSRLIRMRWATYARHAHKRTGYSMEHCVIGVWFQHYEKVFWIKRHKTYSSAQPYNPWPTCMNVFRKKTAFCVRKKCRPFHSSYLYAFYR